MLSGTAAVLAPIGHLIIDGRRVQVGDGQMGTHTATLRSRLLAIQRGEADDAFGWTSAVEA